MILSSLLLTALAAADPCGERAPSPAAAVDARTAAAYARVGRDEENAGSPHVAKLAYAQALSLDPFNEEARQGLRRVCGAAGGSGAILQEAVALMDAGDQIGAIYLLRKVRAAGKNAEAELLEGILHYELGQDALAIPLLRAAEEDPALGPSAELFLGLIALRSGDTAGAAERFASLAQGDDSPLRSTAQNLLRLSRRGGRVVLSAYVEAGYDSNVDLSPGVSLITPGAADAFCGVALSALVRPWRRGPYLLAHGGYRAQTQLIPLDTGVAGAVLGWQLGEQGPRGAAEYELGFVSFGGDPYELSHALNLRGTLPLGWLQISAESITRLERFLTTEFASYSGVCEAALLGAGISPHASAFVELGYGVTRDAAQTSALSYLEHGPSLRVRWQSVPSLRLALAVDYRVRTFDAPESPNLVARREGLLEATLRGELDVGEAWTLYVALEGYHATSNIIPPPDATGNVPPSGYVRFVGSAGIAFAKGVW